MTNPQLKFRFSTDQALRAKQDKLALFLKMPDTKTSQQATLMRLKTEQQFCITNCFQKKLLDDITDLIKDDFPDPTIKEATDSSEFDVLITTGQF